MEYSSANRGYRYTNAAFQLPAVTISESQKQALALLARQYKAVEGDDRLGLGDLFSKLERLSYERIGHSSERSLHQMETIEKEEHVAAALNATMTYPVVRRTGVLC